MCQGAPAALGSATAEAAAAAVAATAAKCDDISENEVIIGKVRALPVAYACGFLGQLPRRDASLLLSPCCGCSRTCMTSLPSSHTIQEVMPSCRFLAERFVGVSPRQQRCTTTMPVLTTGCFSGQDATPHYYSYHKHTTFLERGDVSKLLKRFYVRPAPNTEKQFGYDRLKSNRTDVLRSSQHRYTLESDAFRELKRRVYAALPNTRATPGYWAKCGVLLAITFMVEGYGLYFGPTILSGLFLGYLYAMIGLNVQHDANHGALSSNASINYFFGYVRPNIGVSCLVHF